MLRRACQPLGSWKAHHDLLESSQEPVARGLKIGEEDISCVLVSPSEDAKRQASASRTCPPPHNPMTTSVLEKLLRATSAGAGSARGRGTWSRRAGGRIRPSPFLRPGVPALSCHCTSRVPQAPGRPWRCADKGRSLSRGAQGL